jgi:hypothetical protein
MGNENHHAILDHLGTLDDSLTDLNIVRPTHLTALFHPTPQPPRTYRARIPECSIRPRRFRSTRRLPAASTWCAVRALWSAG